MKTNPRKRPASAADVNRAKDEGFRMGAELMLDLMIYTLGTDFEMTDEWLDRYHERFMAHMDSFAKGYLSKEDMRSTTLEERGWEVRLV